MLDFKFEYFGQYFVRQYFGHQNLNSSKFHDKLVFESLYFKFQPEMDNTEFTEK